MAREFAKAFYKSSAWIKCRRSFIEMRKGIDGGMCEMCKERPGYIVHHIIELQPSNLSDPDITLNHCNMMYLCLECHNVIHSGSGDAIPDMIEYSFDDSGNVLPGHGPMAPRKQR